MERGWIRLHRKIQDNPIWRQKPFSPGQAMVDLLLRATHEPFDKMAGLQTIHLEPGEFFTSLRNLAIDWGWSLKKVRNFVAAREVENFLAKIGTDKGTTFHIVNWPTYQGSGHSQGHTRGTRGAHLQEQKNIYMGDFFSVNEKNHQKHQAAYPGLDLLAEYKKAEAWLEANPTKRKTAWGYPRFVNGWLSRAYERKRGQDQGGEWFEAYPKL